ncbi:MAG TPA: GNAT family N-acetyltransferase [Verrucomicrobiae bacterium]
MAETDLPGADGLRRLVGWNQTPEDWVRMLRLEPDGCFVATRDGLVVGSVTTTAYGQTLAWIGMMLVHPKHRRQGIGRQLMRQAIQSLNAKKVRCIKLDATPAGFPLYQQLGFVSEWTLTRHQRAAGHAAAPGAAVAPDTRDLRETDWAAIEESDTRAFGVCRADLLRSLVQDSRRALVWPANGPVLGWGLLRPGANADYLGPLVCANDEGSISLAGALLCAAGDRPVFWDVPDQNLPARGAAQRFGFAPVRPLTRMRLGPEIVSNDPRSQFAIADPAVG